MFIHDKAHKQSVCAYLKCFAHRIHSFPLWSSEKRPVQNTQSASCSSSSVESSAKGTARSVPNLMEWQTELDPGKPFSSVFWRTKKSIQRKCIGFGFSCLFDFIFLSCPNKFSVRWTRYFLCCSTTSVWLYVQALQRADTWRSESFSRSVQLKTNTTE